jgi:DNA polymerase-1
MQAYKLQYEINVSLPEAERLRADYFAAFPELDKWFKNTLVQARTDGYMTTQAGRIRRFPELKEHYAKYGPLLLDQLEMWKRYHEEPRTYAEVKRIAKLCKNDFGNALNIQIQGLTSSIINRASVAIAKEFKRLSLDASITASIHDELLIECDERIVDIVAPMVQNLMENTYKISVELPAPPSVGHTYADAKNEKNEWKKKDI